MFQNSRHHAHNLRRRRFGIEQHGVGASDFGINALLSMDQFWLSSRCISGGATPPSATQVRRPTETVIYPTHTDALKDRW